MLIMNSEKDGSHNLTPHSALDPGDPIAIKVQNAFNQTGGYRKNFMIYTTKSETVFSLRKKVAKELAIKEKADGTKEIVGDVPHPMKIKLRYQEGSAFKNIDDNTNG